MMQFPYLSPFHFYPQQSSLSMPIEDLVLEQQVNFQIQSGREVTQEGIIPLSLSPVSLNFQTSENVKRQNPDALQIAHPYYSMLSPRQSEYKPTAHPTVEANVNHTQDDLKTLSQKELKRIARKQKNRVYAQQSRNRKQQELKKLKEQRERFLQLGEEIESFLKIYCHAIPSSFLKPNPTLEKSIVAISKLGTDEAVTAYHERIQKVIKTLIKETIINYEVFQLKQNDLKLRIQQLEEENAKLK